MLRIQDKLIVSHLSSLPNQKFALTMREISQERHEHPSSTHPESSSAQDRYDPVSPVRAPGEPE